MFPGTSVLLTSDRPPGQRPTLPPDDEARVVPLPPSGPPADLCAAFGGPAEEQEAALQVPENLVYEQE